MPTDKIDHAVGFDNLVGIGAEVDKSTPIARIHACDESSATQATQRIIQAYHLDAQGEENPIIHQTIMPKDV